MNNIMSRIINKIILIEDEYAINLDEIKPLQEYQNEYKFEKLDIKSLDELFNVNTDVKFEKLQQLKLRVLGEDMFVYSILVNKEYIGYFCVSYVNTLENGINKEIFVNEKSSYLFDDYIFAKYRGNGYHKISVYERLLCCKADNKSSAIVNVYRTNVKSAKTYTNIGFKRTKTYYYLPVFSKMLYIKLM